MRISRTALMLSLAFAPRAAGLAANLDPVVQERQAEMKAMSAAAKSISERFSGRKPYDAAEFRAEARLIARMGGERLIAHISSITAADGSQARDEIAVERARFYGYARELAAYAEQVAAAAADGEAVPASMRMRAAEMTEGGPFARKREKKPDFASYSSEHAFHMMLQTCSSCHAAFRR